MATASGSLICLYPASSSSFPPSAAVGMMLLIKYSAPSITASSFVPFITILLPITAITYCAEPFSPAALSASADCGRFVAPMSISYAASSGAVSGGSQSSSMAASALKA